MKRFVLAALLSTAGCVTGPAAVHQGCDAVGPIEGHDGWVLWECAHPFSSSNPDKLPEACAPTRGAAQHAGSPSRIPCGWTDAVTDCVRKEVRIYWHATAGAYEHELTHVRECK